MAENRRSAAGYAAKIGSMGRREGVSYLVNTTASAPPGPGAVTNWRQDRELILARYLDSLRAADSPLVHADDHVLSQVRSQLYSVVDAVATRLRVAPSHDSESAGDELSSAIGRSRAGGGIHPTQSLQAATLIFEAALPIITNRLTAAHVPEPLRTAALELNREILHRMAVSARAYVDYLLDKAQSSNRDERRRLSRELHDVAAPAVALGLQNLELFEIYSETDPDRAAHKIQAARQSLLDALTTIRGLSAQSRVNVGERGLTAAINGYLDTLPSVVSRTLHVDGDVDAIPLALAEELFLIVREAARNAIDHASPQHLAIELRLGPGVVRATIRDDGGGFDVPRTMLHERHIGLDSMYERAELLGARLTIESKPGAGTTIGIVVSTGDQPPLRPAS
jgi:signal transduction histidine kinase